MRAARHIGTNAWYKARVLPEHMLVEPQCWAVLDYATLESPDVRATVAWSLERPATAHGVGVWFDATLAEGVSFSTAPGAPDLVYGRAFFPWTRPVALAVGDTVTVALRATLVGQSYVWSWNTSIHGGGDQTHVKAEFRQSTFFDRPLSTVNLRKRAESYVPTLIVDGQIARFVLTSMDGTTSLYDIARQVAARFPARFPAWRDASAVVGDLSHRYG